MAKILFLGDCHGDWGVVNDVLQRTKKSNIPIIQVGDLGLGFVDGYEFNRRTCLWEQVPANDPKEFPERFRFIRGNHDAPAACRQYPNYMGDFGYDEKTGIFFVSGAWSIDRAIRKEGVNWWPDEELSYEQLQNAIDLYEKIKPNIVVSHTCPAAIMPLLVGAATSYPHRTENALNAMWEIHKPKRWIFGHYHQVWRKTILDTDFICCAINGKVKLDLENFT